MTHPLADVAVRTVADCCRVARDVQQRVDAVRAMTKDDRSPVTVADFAVQAIVSMALAEHDPAVEIVGEENADALREPAQALLLQAVTDAVRLVRPEATAEDVLTAIARCDHDGTSDGFWTLDPIDGTKGFLRGEQYAIALAWLEDQVVDLGVLGCPNLGPGSSGFDTADPDGAIYAASFRDGAWAYPDGNVQSTPVTLKASQLDAGDLATIRVCESVEKEHSKQSDTGRIVEALGSTSTPVRLDSQCKYAVVGRGDADAYLRLPTRPGYVEKIWDHAAGSLIAREAGAVVTDITGAPLDFTHGPRLERNRGVICASAAIHPKIIEVIDRLGIGAAVESS